MKKIVITGGAGFVGSQLGHALDGLGYEVLLIDNMSRGHLDNLIIDGKSFGTFLCKDIRDQDLNQTLRDCDVVVHLAGISALPVCQSRPQYAIDVNTSGTANILEAARLANVKKVLFSSTSAVYENNLTSPFTETDIVCPDLIYSMSKWQAEQICSAYEKNYDLNIGICRFFNVYGPHQDFKRASPPFTSYLARELAADRVPTLFNKTSVKRDYIHVDDVISLLIKMIEYKDSMRANIYNICTGNGYSVPEIYEKFLQISGKKIQPKYADPAKFWESYKTLTESQFPLNKSRVEKEVYKESIGSNAKASADFSWAPQIALTEGLRSVYEYALSNLGAQ
jgi:nucleoside-diphosphate-sugar epimerase